MLTNFYLNNRNSGKNSSARWQILDILSSFDPSRIKRLNWIQVGVLAIEIAPRFPWWVSSIGMSVDHLFVSLSSAFYQVPAM